METFSELLAICAGNSPVTGEFPAQRPETLGFGVFFDLRLNKRLSKQSWGWWFEKPLPSLWRHSNDWLRRRLSLYCYDNLGHISVKLNINRIRIFFFIVVLSSIFSFESCRVVLIYRHFNPVIPCITVETKCNPFFFIHAPLCQIF